MGATKRKKNPDLELIIIKPIAWFLKGFLT